MRKHILHVVTNVAHYANPAHATGLWLSELTHAWHMFADAGYEQHLVSPNGGLSPLEPRSLKWPNIDNTARQWLIDPASMELLATTDSPDNVDAGAFDAIYFTGGHGVMYDFPGAAGIQRITRDIFESGGVVSAVCHGYCGLLETQLSSGALLVQVHRAIVRPYMRWRPTCDEQLGQGRQHAIALELARDRQRQAFPARLVDDRQDPVFAPIMGAALDEVVGPDMAGIFRSEPDT